MFHQVFISDTPEEEQHPNISQQINEVILSTEPNFGEIEMKSNEIAFVKKLEEDIKNVTFKPLDKLLTLGVKSEIDLEENKSELKMNLDLMIRQDNEALCSTSYHLDEGSGHLMKECNEQRIVNKINNNNTIISGICEDFNDDNTFLFNSKENDIVYLLNKREILEHKNNENNKSCNIVDKQYQENKSIIVDSTSGVHPTSIKLSDTHLPSDTFIGSDNDEDPNNVTGQICNAYESSKQPFVPKQSKRMPLSYEESSGSDWEQEYLSSKRVNVKRKVSKGSRKQIVNTTSSDYNQTKHPVEKSFPINLFPLEIYKIVNMEVESMPGSNSVVGNKVMIPILTKMKDIKIENGDKQCVGNKVMVPRLTKKKDIKIENGEKQFICSVCYKHFNTKAQMLSHVKTVCFGNRQVLNYQCDMCGISLGSKGKLQNHKNSHANEKPFKCTECDKCFNSPASRSWHYKTTHQNINVAKYLCSFCGITSQNIYHLLAHEETHRLPEGAETPLPFKCFQCGRGYISKYRLKEHIKHQHKGCKCTYCSKHLETRNVLNLHLRDVHNIVKHFKCKSCDKVFGSYGNLKIHNSVHSALQYFCEICDKGFKLKGHIKQHLRTHSNEKPLSCPDCGDCFKRKTHLIQHISTIHGKGKKR